MANTQQSPLCKPPGIPCPARQGALQKEPTPQAEPDPSHDLTLETGLDETLEHSWATFSFGKENQTRMPWISLIAGCWDFSIYLENRLCCNTCALSLTGLSFSAHHFLAEAAHDSSTFPLFGLLALLPFCIFSVSCLGEEYPSKSQISIQQSTWQPRTDFCTNESWAAFSQGTCPAGHSGSVTGAW